MAEPERRSKMDAYIDLDLNASSYTFLGDVDPYCSYKLEKHYVFHLDVPSNEKRHNTLNSIRPCEDRLEAFENLHVAVEN
ncbi:hypothetical protein OPV22_029723 [Ensete ventricosum]|uniref:Uncharacterized protein n=1 Tax=Ensete ventricosum TaxID=4639 RepID=A0AAV8Q431_ENSVE|nr:hypothetical protein OPV22_029723 [Ensete ventricosum]